jgi:hypothetical protein
MSSPARKDSGAAKKKMTTKNKLSVHEGMIANVQ